MSFRDWLIESFPTPEFLTMPAAALDISPNSIKYLDGEYTTKGCVPHVFDEVFLEPGTIEGGVIKKNKDFISALAQLHNKYGRDYAFVAIPENAVYLYTMRITGRPNKQAVKQQIEFSFNEYVPIKLEESVYDFEMVRFIPGGVEVSVTVAPKNLISSYSYALHKAGFRTRSMELEAYAIVRAVTLHKHYSGSDTIEMIVDIGYERAGIILANNGLPVFTITVKGGGKNLPAVIDEAKKQYTFWDTRTNSKGRRIERIDNVIVCGGSGKKAIPELQKAINKEIVEANVWHNLFDLDKYIPTIDSDQAISMATLAGLLLNNKR